MVSAAERRLDFGAFLNKPLPADWKSLVSGEGAPGEWKVILDEVPSPLPSLNPNFPQMDRKPVLAQISQDPTDEHFPLLLVDDETYGDFEFSVRMKAVSGKKEQMAGIVFRAQDEKNYYILRISSLGNTFRFYKFVNGMRYPAVGKDLPIPSGVWHEVKVQCEGHTIRCFLNGEQVIPDLTDPSFTVGKIGFWTKSDSVSHFADPFIRYKPRIPFAQSLVRDILKENPRLLDIKIFAFNPDRTRLSLIACKEPSDLGKEAGEVEHNVLERSLIYFGRGKDTASVTFPLRDNNGEPMAAIRVEMRSFPGQTENNAVTRALPIVKAIEDKVKTYKDLTQ